MTMATTQPDSGRRLAERLGLKIVGTEGHDVKTACVSCKSSDAGRVHVEKGIFHCYACKKSLNAFDLCKVVLNDKEAAKRLMIDVGILTIGRRQPVATGTPLQPAATARSTVPTTTPDAFAFASRSVCRRRL